jgi:hypothetical protein
VICEVCNARGPTAYVEFHQNIGLVLARLSKSVKGELCRTCIDKHFWEFTLVTVLLGWCGFISLFVAPIFVVSNVLRFVGTRVGETGAALKKPAGRGGDGPSSHPTLTLTEQARRRLSPFEEEIRSRLCGGEAFEVVAGCVARKAGVSAAQAELYAASFTAL